MGKTAVFIVLLVSLLAYVNSSSNTQSHNVSWGTHGVNDVHIQRTVVHKKSSFLQKVEDDFEFNLKPTPYVRQITAIVVTDQYTNGNGGYATLSHGGPLSSSVRIHFTSQRGHGFNFIIDIYGR